MEASNSKLRPLDDTFNTANASLSDLRTCFIFVVSFVSLLRYDELIHITCRNVGISPGHMTIFCPNEKTTSILKVIQYFSVVQEKSCPVLITEKLFANLPNFPDQHLVCRLNISSNGTAQKAAISYS